jgi:hypothetical protein
METAATFSWVVPVTALLVVLGFAAFALWFVLRLDRDRHND